MRKVITSATGIVLVAIALAKLLGYVYRIVLSRLGPDQYGVFSIALAIFGIVFTISVLGLDQGILRHLPYYKGAPRKQHQYLMSSLVLAFIASVFLAVLLWFFAPMLAERFNIQELTTVLRILSISIPFASVGWLLFSVLQAEKRIFANVSLRYLGDSVLKVVLTLLLFSFVLSLPMAAWAHVLTLIITCVIAFFLVWPSFSQSSYDFRTPLLYSLPLLFSGFFYLIIRWTDVLMIGYIRGSSEAGIYSVALPTAALLLVVQEAVLYLFVPTMTTHIMAEKTQEAKSLVIRSFFTILILSAPLFLLFIFFPRILLQTFFGGAYLLGVIPLVILAWGYFVSLPFSVFNSTFASMKKTPLILAIAAVAAVANIILNALLIPVYGMIGGAIATTSALLIMAVLRCGFGLYYLRRLSESY